jgi:nucleoside-diphosphate-sugar epimerase
MGGLAAAGIRHRGSGIGVIGMMTMEQLEEVLSRPGEADCDAMRSLDGDLLILGVGGKMGPSLAMRARRACEQVGLRTRVIGVSRFGDAGQRAGLERHGVETIAADLMDRKALQTLPDAANVIFMAGRKFGTHGGEHWTWAMNVLLPAMVAERFRDAHMVVFSSGNVYPLRNVAEGGASEDVPTDPVGEYAQTVRGRERVFQFYAEQCGTPSVLLRLNYAVEMRYGVLVDIARKVYERRPVDVTMGHVNVIWQGDANGVALRSFRLCAVPPAVLNVTGPETLTVRWIAGRFGELFGVEPHLEGTEANSALLNDAHRCSELFGPPEVSVEQTIEWTAEWIRAGGPSLNKPTHFEARDGRF